MIDNNTLSYKVVCMRFPVFLIAHAEKMRKKARRPDGLKQTLSRQLREWALAGMELQNPIRTGGKQKTKKTAATEQLELFSKESQGGILSECGECPEGAEQSNA